MFRSPWHAVCETERQRSERHEQDILSRGQERWSLRPGQAGV